MLFRSEYDLVINTGPIGYATTAELIMRGLKELARSAKVT